MPWNGQNEAHTRRLADAVENLCYSLLEQEHGGWQDNDGGTVAQVFGGSLTRTTQQPGSVPLPTSVDNTSVLIGFQPAPLYFVSSDQINVQIPTELEPDREYAVLVSSGSAFASDSATRLTTS